MDIQVCVGSSCHLKGSYNIINLMKEYLEKNNLTEQVVLRAVFCLGKCANGVTIKVDNEIICGVSNDNFPAIFSKYVLEKQVSKEEYVLNE